MEMQNLDEHNILNSDNLQNQNEEIPHTMQSLPETNQNSQNQPQSSPPVYNPPLGVNVEQNISQIPHKNITQPHKNLFVIYTGIVSKLQAFSFLIVGCLLLICSPLSIVIKIKDYVAMCFAFLGLGCVFFGIGIHYLLKLSYLVNLELGDNYLIAQKKSICCKNKVTNYQKGDLIRLEFTHKTQKKENDTIHYYKLFLILKGDKKKRLFHTNSKSNMFTEEEIKYLLYYINNHIAKKM